MGGVEIVIAVCGALGYWGSRCVVKQSQHTPAAARSPGHLADEVFGLQHNILNKRILSV